jgi:hypothetical protein
MISGRRVSSIRKSIADMAIRKKVFGRARLRTADHCLQPDTLLPGDESQCSTGRTRQHGPVGIFGLSQISSLFQQKHRAGFHLFRDPLIEEVQISDHKHLFCRFLVVHEGVGAPNVCSWGTNPPSLDCTIYGAKHIPNSGHVNARRRVEGFL